MKNICERQFLNVVFNRNKEQHLLVKLHEMEKDIIMFYVYLYHFGIIIFVFYLQAVVRWCSLKSCFKKFRKIHKKTPVLESLFKHR